MANKMFHRSAITETAVYVYVHVMCSKLLIQRVVLTGDYVIVEPIEEGNKVAAEIIHILYSKQVKYLKKENLW